MIRKWGRHPHFGRRTFSHMVMNDTSLFCFSLGLNLFKVCKSRFIAFLLCVYASYFVFNATSADKEKNTTYLESKVPFMASDSKLNSTPQAQTKRREAALQCQANWPSRESHEKGTFHGRHKASRSVHLPKTLTRT